MTTKINKALDFNKLLNEQKQGKLLKKHVRFPLLVPIKYDGNYVVVMVSDEGTTFNTSGGLTYTHTDDGGKIFEGVAVVVGRCLARHLFDKPNAVPVLARGKTVGVPVQPEVAHQPRLVVVDGSLDKMREIPE